MLNLFFVVVLLKLNIRIGLKFKCLLILNIEGVDIRNRINECKVSIKIRLNL